MDLAYWSGEKDTQRRRELLFAEAKQACGAATDTDTVRLGLEALVRHAAYERLRALRGSEPRAQDVPRRRERARRTAAPGCVMVLVDTSVWIRFLANRAPYAAEIDRLLSRDEVKGHALVFGELLIGDRGDRTSWLALYGADASASVVPHREVVAFVRDRDLHGRGIG